MDDLPEHVRRNRNAWDKWAPDYADAGARAWARDEPTWGIWGVPESQVRMLPADLAGKDAIELGCGTAYVSAWLARRDARVVGIDNSEAQLATARGLQRKHGLEFPLLHGNAEAVAYPGESFDLAISEYGACLWAAAQTRGIRDRRARRSVSSDRLDDALPVRHASVGAFVAERGCVESAQARLRAAVAWEGTWTNR